MRGFLASLAIGLISVPASCWAQSACDLNGSGGVDVVDVQLAINMNLGLIPCTASIYSPGVCNVIVVQRVINSALGGTCVTGTGSGHSASLTWTASTTPNVTYNVYRGTLSGGPYTKINTAAVSGVGYSDTAVLGGATYYYVVTAVNGSGTESGYSNQAAATIPSP